VKADSDAGIEGRSFLLAEGRSAGRLSARYRAANFPRHRIDGALVRSSVACLRPTMVAWSSSSGRGSQ